MRMHSKEVKSIKSLEKRYFSYLSNEMTTNLHEILQVGV